MSDPGDRHLLALRYLEIDAELTAIEEGRVVDGDRADVEAARENQRRSAGPLACDLVLDFFPKS